MATAKINLPKLAGTVLLCELAGGIGSVFTISAIPTWYATLNKPIFSPPNWLFGPVWTTLYALMGISLYLVWMSKTNKKQKTTALRTFYIQLGLNVLWSFLFFGLKNPILGFVGIIFLLIYIVKTRIQFLKISSLSGNLLIPYIAWSSFATLLNLAIVILN